MVVFGVAVQLQEMQYAKHVKLRMRDCMNDEDANIGPAIIGLAIIVAMIWLCILIVKGIIAIVSYIFSVLSDVASGLVGSYFDHQEYIHSSEFLLHTLALVGGIYLASYLFIPLCKLVDSLMEIVVVLPFILVAWTFDMFIGIILFIQKSLVRPWNPDFENGAPTFDNRHYK